MSRSAVDLLLGVDHVEELVLRVEVLLVDGAQRLVVLHQVLALREEDHGLLPAEVQLLLDDGQHLAHLEGVRHQEPIAG